MKVISCLNVKNIAVKIINILVKVGWTINFRGLLLSTLINQPLFYIWWECFNWTIAPSLYKKMKVISCLNVKNIPITGEVFNVIFWVYYKKIIYLRIKCSIFLWIVIIIIGKCPKWSYSSCLWIENTIIWLYYQYWIISFLKELDNY
jgi:hypothetical protein